jgi:hypothetical protein
VRSAGKTLGEGAQGAGKAVQDAGDTLGSVARKAKGPALAGGAALAGLAGGIALAGRPRRRRVLGMPLPGTRKPLIKLTAPRRARLLDSSKDLAKAANDVGTAGRQVGELVSEVRRVRREVERSGRRSPIEVVLDGLTSRRDKS